VETAELISESDHSLEYKTSVGDWDAICTYYFDKGVFYMAAYRLDIKHKDKNPYHTGMPYTKMITTGSMKNTRTTAFFTGMP